MPALREVFQFIEIITDAADLFSCAGEVSKPVPELGLENVLVHSGADCNTNGATKASCQI